MQRLRSKYITFSSNRLNIKRRITPMRVHFKKNLNLHHLNMLAKFLKPFEHVGFKNHVLRNNWTLEVQVLYIIILISASY